MSEHHQPDPNEVPHRPSPEADQHEAFFVYDLFEQMADKIQLEPNPRPGIQKWFKSDIPANGLYVVDCNSNTLQAHQFQAELHDQDSADRVWEFRFSDHGEGEAQQHVWGLAVSNKSACKFLLSPIQCANTEPQFTEFRQSFKQLWSYANDEHHLYGGNTTGALFTLWAAVQNFHDGYDSVPGYKPGEAHSTEGYDRDIADLAASGATIPGIALKGTLIHSKA